LSATRVNRIFVRTPSMEKNFYDKIVRQQNARLPSPPTRDHSCIYERVHVDVVTSRDCLNVTSHFSYSTMPLSSVSILTCPTREHVRYSSSERVRASELR